MARQRPRPGAEAFALGDRRMRVGEEAMAKMKSMALAFKYPLTRHAVRAKPKPAKVKLWRAVIMAHVGIELGKQPGRNAKEEALDAYLMLIEKARHQELRDDAAPLLSDVSDESLDRLLRANDNHAHDEGGGGLVSGKTLWSIFDEARVFVRDVLVPEFRRLTGSADGALPPGTDIESVLMLLRVAILRQGVEEWGQRQYEKKKKPTMLRGYGLNITAEEARSLNDIPGDDKSKELEGLARTKGFYPPFFAVFLYFCDSSQLLDRVDRKLSRAERRDVDATGRRPKRFKFDDAGSNDEALVTAHLVRAQVDVRHANELKMREMSVHSVLQRLRIAKEELDEVRRRLSRLEESELSSEDETDEPLSPLERLGAEKKRLKALVKKLKVEADLELQVLPPSRDAVAGSVPGAGAGMASARTLGRRSLGANGSARRSMGERDSLMAGLPVGDLFQHAAAAASATGSGGVGPGSVGPGSVGPGSVGPGSVGPGSVGPASAMNFEDLEL